MDIGLIQTEINAYSSMFPAITAYPNKFNAEEKKAYLRDEAARLRKDAEHLEALADGRLVRWDENELQKS